MPIRDILHAIQDISDFDGFMQGVLNSQQQNYYYHSAKRKRKTCVPQKREISGDEMDYDLKLGCSFEAAEPINLINKDSPKSNQICEKAEKHKESSDSENKGHVEQNRIYNLLLNYLLMKYQPQMLNGHFPFDRYKNELINRENSSYTSTSSLVDTHMSECASFERPFASNLDSFNGCNYFHQNGSENSSDFPSRYPQFLDMTCKQSIIYSIHSCVHSIPPPKTGMLNYDNLVVIYKALIEKAYALQNSIDQYLTQFQNASIPAPPNSKTQSGVCVPVAEIGLQSPNSTVLIPSVRPALSKLKFNLYQNTNDLFSHSRELQKCKTAYSAHSKSEYSTYKASSHPNSIAFNGIQACKIDDGCTFPVDLTKNEKCENRKIIAENEKESVFEYGLSFTNVCGYNLPKTNKDRLTFPALASNTFEYNRSPHSDHLDNAAPYGTREREESPLGSSSESAAVIHPDLLNSNPRKKAYFKSKRLKKTFTASSSMFSENESPDGTQVKKSNFRGTSEEENKVSPEFRPIEVNGQILLSEAHPNVTISKDIFYSLIVKSSGSATRLIRLLMKSFFTQDELAASSLSGEGIYKQRLKPSVTEAIKTFIRRRHPQLKTGSINLCMTDVCVQARRVANNQRTRQHPLRLVTQPSSEITPSHISEMEMASHESVSILGLKSRSLSCKRPASVSRQENNAVDLVEGNKLVASQDELGSVNWTFLHGQLGRPEEQSHCWALPISNECPQFRTDEQFSDTILDSRINQFSSSSQDSRIPDGLESCAVGE
ncbi:unnamed protein product [Dicrocoelium dendriticum]|nr:unnamed protein product [Dicrocoelium dendriticum]